MPSTTRLAPCLSTNCPYSRLGGTCLARAQRRRVLGSTGFLERKSPHPYGRICAPYLAIRECGALGNRLPMP